MRMGGDKNVQIIVVFFGFVLVSLGVFHYLYYNGVEYDDRDKLDNLDNEKSPFARYIGGLYHSNENDISLRRNIRDIKQFVSRADESYHSKGGGEENNNVKQQKKEGLDIRTSPDKGITMGEDKGMSGLVKRPQSVKIPSVFKNIDKKTDLENKETITTKNMNIIDNTSADDDDDDSSSSVIIFMIVVSLPAVVIIFVIAGLVASYAWQDMVRVNEDYNSSGDIGQSNNKDDGDIETGYVSTSGCIQSCAHMMPSSGVVSQRKNKGKRRRNNRKKIKGKTKSVTFGPVTVNKFTTTPTSMFKTTIDDLLPSGKRQKSAAGVRNKRRKNKRRPS